MHIRQLVRDAFVATLTGMPTIGTNVFIDHPHVLTDGELPGIIVDTPSEQVLVDESTFTETLRDLQVFVNVYAKALPSGQMDDIAADVEALMMVDCTLGGIVQNTLLLATTLELADDVEERVARCSLQFSVLYVSPRADPETSL